GQAIAVSGNFALIGAPMRDLVGNADAGGVYLFDLANGRFVREIANPVSVLAGDQFGFSIALDGSILAIGAPLRDDGGIADAGAVYVYDFVTFALLATLQKPGSHVAGDRFGFSIAVANGLIAVSAPFQDEPGASDAGAVYLFDARVGTLLGTFKKP